MVILDAMISISSKIRLDAMSKVISFSISDRYLAKIRTLYPSLSDNLAAKQFLTDRLDEGLSSSLDASLDDGLDDRVKTLVESWVDGLLDERLDATVGKLIGDLSERLARLESRLDDGLDGNLDDGLDGNLDDGLDDMEPLLRLQREASIATSPLPPSPSLPPDKLGEGGNGDIFPDSPPSPPDQPAIEEIKKKITLPDTSIVYPIGIVETVEPDSTIDTESGAIETLPGDTSPTDEPVEQNLTNKKIASILGIDNSNLSKWLKTKIIPEKYRDKCQFNHNKTKIVLI